MQLKSAIEELNATNSEEAKQEFYSKVLDSDLWIAITDIPAAVTPQAPEFDGFTPFQVLSAMGPDGSPVLLAFTDEEAIGEKIKGMEYKKYAANDVLCFVKNGAYGGIIINPNGPWAGIPKSDLQSMKLAEPISLNT